MIAPELPPMDITTFYPRSHKLYSPSKDELLMREKQLLEALAENAQLRGELNETRQLQIEEMALCERAREAAEADNAKLRAEIEQAYKWLKDLYIEGYIPTQDDGEAAAWITRNAPPTDLSNGVELEDAVRKFETSIMAPANYKRPTALVSKAMIEKARLAIEELGLTSALERRYAVPEDVTVNNVLYADRNSVVTTRREGNVFEELTAAVPVRTQKLGRIDEVGVEKFLTDVLPTATSLEVLFETRFAGNLVSLIAPVDPTAKLLFKWPNPFSWSYAGDVADSIKERVKRAGGSVTGDLCCRLAWGYTDDLDFHMLEPGATRNTTAANSAWGWEAQAGRFTHIYYGNKRQLSANGGVLDIDANGGDGQKAEPAENIYYASKHTMQEGIYELRVNNYNRSSNGVGFEVEVEFGSTTFNFVYDKVLPNGATVVVAKIQYKDGSFTIVESLPSTKQSKQVWGLQTETFQRVSMVTLSPNYWVDRDDSGPFSKATCKHDFTGVGNKHWFFMLQGCANEGKARPFYNEFLSSELEPHRKTMEIIGAKLRTDEEARQLSGLGFSSTRHDTLTVRVGGKFSRVLKVVV